MKPSSPPTGHARPQLTRARSRSCGALWPPATRARSSLLGAALGLAVLAAQVVMGTLPASASTATPAAVVHLGNKDNGRTLQVRRGAQVDVYLTTASTAAASATFRWAQPRSSNGPVLALLSGGRDSKGDAWADFVANRAGHASIRATRSCVPSTGYVCPLYILLWHVDIDVLPSLPIVLSAREALGTNNPAPGDCTTNTSEAASSVGFVVLKVTPSSFQAEIQLQAGSPNTSYGVFMQQVPGSCPQSSANGGTLTTGPTGLGHASTTVPRVAGATTFFVQLVSGASVYTSDRLSVVPQG